MQPPDDLLGMVVEQTLRRALAGDEVVRASCDPEHPQGRGPSSPRRSIDPLGAQREEKAHDGHQSHETVRPVSNAEPDSDGCEQHQEREQGHEPARPGRIFVPELLHASGQAPHDEPRARDHQAQSHRHADRAPRQERLTDQEPVGKPERGRDDGSYVLVAAMEAPPHQLNELR